MTRSHRPLVMPFLFVCNAAAAAEPADSRAVLSFDEPAYVNMPIWVRVTLPKSKKFRSAQRSIRYPFSTTPWDFGLHEFEVTRNGAPHPRIKMKFPLVESGGGIVGGSVAPPTSPKGRFPLHLQCKFVRPGVYQVRFKVYNTDFVTERKVVCTSEWTSLEVAPFTHAERRAWLKEREARAPKDVGLLVGDYLPSIFAHPDKEVLDILLSYLHHPSGLVQSFAMNGLMYCDDATLLRELLPLLKRKGPTRLLAHVLSWRRDLFQPQGVEILASVIPFLKSDSAIEVGGAIQSLIFLRAHYSWEEHPGIPARINRAVLDAVEHVRAFPEREARQPLCCFLGSIKSDRSRELLWELAADAKVRDQALICLTWIADARDLPKLARLVVEGDRTAGSLPYHLRRAYGKEAVPYLMKALGNSPNRILRLKCARALAFEGKPQAFAFFRDAVASNRRCKSEAVQFLRDHFGLGRDTDDDETLAFLDSKMRELSGKKH